MPTKRKLQVSNGHYLMFDQLARLIYVIDSTDENRKISMSYLEGETGLPFRQVRNRISIGRAMGIFEGHALRLTPFGHLVSTHDKFFDSIGTLEYMHYSAAGNYKNLVWYEAFNTLLPGKPPISYSGWVKYFRSSLAKEYTDHSLKDHVGKEVRFVIDAYINKGLKRLKLLCRASDGRLYLRRYTEPKPLIFCAMLYDYSKRYGANVLQITDISKTKGSPPVLFAMDQSTLRQELEGLHEQGWIRYETTHDLDQIRLRAGSKPLDFLEAYYEDRELLPESEAKGLKR